MPAPGQKPHNHTSGLNKSGLTKLYNSQVKSVTPIERPMDMGKGLKVPFAKHKAVLVQLENGKCYVIEKGGTYSAEGSYKAIIKDANNLGSKMGWR